MLQIINSFLSFLIDTLVSSLLDIQQYHFSFAGSPQFCPHTVPQVPYIKNWRFQCCQPLTGRAMLYVSQYLRVISVRLSITFAYSVEMNKHIFTIFFTMIPVILEGGGVRPNISGLCSLRRSLEPSRNSSALFSRELPPTAAAAPVPQPPATPGTRVTGRWPAISFLTAASSQRAADVTVMIRDDGETTPTQLPTVGNSLPSNN